MVNAYKYWTLRQVDVMSLRDGIANDEELRGVVAELLSVYTEHCASYSICDWQPSRAPENIYFYNYDREEGWRLGGQFHFGKDELTLNVRYKKDRIWGGYTVRGTIAHELWHSRGMHVVRKSKNPTATLTWGDVWKFQKFRDETFCQLGSSDVLAHAITEIGPEYEAAFYSFMQSIIAGTMVYDAWYDGMALHNIPTGVTDVHTRMDKLRVQANLRKDGKTPSSEWRIPYKADYEGESLLGKFTYKLNQKLAQLRRKAMQAEYWELRRWAYDLLQPSEGFESKNIRFRKWLQIPEEHAEALLEYDVMPFLLLLQSKENTVSSQMEMATVYGPIVNGLSLKFEGVVPRFWEGLVAAEWAELPTVWDYIIWMYRYTKGA